MQREQRAQNAIVWYTLKSWQHFHSRQHVEKVKKKDYVQREMGRETARRTNNVKWVCEDDDDDDDDDEKEDKDCT
jgi:hypothetical protein